MDVVIPHGPNDDETIAPCVARARWHAKGCRTIHVVSHDADALRARLALLPPIEGVVVVPETAFPFGREEVRAELEAGDGRPVSQATGEPPIRVGWYLQQLIKLRAFDGIPGLSSTYLVMDADVMLLRDVAFEHDRFVPAREHHAPYFEHMARLIPGLGRTHAALSGVSHLMVMERDRLLDIAAEAELQPWAERRPFWRLFLAAVSPGQARGSGASEYELYFNFSMARRAETARIVVDVPWTNCASMEEAAALPEGSVAYVALHHYHRRF